MREFDQLQALVARLRDPQGGCPWDREQDYHSIVPHTLEEAYEVADAIARGDREELRAELGDLLFQVVFYAQLAAEEGVFDLRDVVAAVVAKMTARHPHVFGNAVVASAAEQTRAWEGLKAEERAAQRGATSALDGVALALPALTRALKLQRRAARVGFDWGAVQPVLAKIDEELAEIRHEIAVDAPRARLQDEVGDVLFACANLARHLGIDPEAALRGTNAKFERRFRFVEAALAAEGRGAEQATLAEMDHHWERAKSAERDG